MSNMKEIMRDKETPWVGGETLLCVLTVVGLLVAWESSYKNVSIAGRHRVLNRGKYEIQSEWN